MQTSPQTRTQGFSLVEVVLAVTITSTVAMSLVALLPAGMEGMRQSAVISAQARIMQTIASQCQMTDWATLTSTGYQSGIYAFDYQGGQLEDGQGGDTCFLARARVSTAPSLPGLTSSNPRTRLLRIEIVNGNSDTLFTTGKPVTLTTQVAQMDNTP